MFALLSSALQVCFTVVSGYVVDAELKRCGQLALQDTVGQLAHVQMVALDGQWTDSF